MYNRYVPQPDGSYRRNRVPDASRPQPKRQEPSCQEPVVIPSPEPAAQCGQRSRTPRKEPQDTSISGFLKRILPKDFDTGDLLIVVLLLLMAGDCAEDKNTILLTLLLYFLM